MFKQNSFSTQQTTFLVSGPGHDHFKTLFTWLRCAHLTQPYQQQQQRNRVDVLYHQALPREVSGEETVENNEKKKDPRVCSNSNRWSCQTQSTKRSFVCTTSCQGLKFKTSGVDDEIAFFLITIFRIANFLAKISPDFSFFETATSIRINI